MGEKDDDFLEDGEVWVFVIDEERERELMETLAEGFEKRDVLFEHVVMCEIVRMHDEIIEDVIGEEVVYC
jgi:hypothetical protein